MPLMSRYNQFYPWQGGNYLAYNARSGAVALMTGDKYALYQTLAEKLSAGVTDELTPDEETLLKQLEYGKFVHADTLDELEAIKFDHRHQRFNESALGLVLAPTMACNMACIYCFEGNKKGRMSAETQEALIKFIADRAQKLTAVSISWYGGEPLLAQDIIDNLTKAVLELAEQHKFVYEATMVTNGYLLTPEVVDKLMGWKVKSLQVTIDGPARVHNQKRPLRNGQPSFETIIENIKYASSRIGVGIRVSVDKNTTREIIDELLTEFERAGLARRVTVNFGQIEASTSVCANISESCYDMSEFSKVEVDYYALLLQRGFFIQKLPSPSPTFCMAQMAGSFLVDSDGDLYRCFNYVGDKNKSMGNLRNPVDYTNPNFVSLFRFDPFEDANCRNCHILPVCMGSCPSRRADRGLSTEEVCETWKYNLQPMLGIIAWSRQQAAQAKQAAEAAKETV